MIIIGQGLSASRGSIRHIYCTFGMHMYDLLVYICNTLWIAAYVLTVYGLIDFVA